MRDSILRPVACLSENPPVLMPDFIDLSTYARMGQAEASRKKNSFNGSGSILQ